MLERLGVGHSGDGSGAGLRWGAVGAIVAAVLVVAWLVFGGRLQGDSETSADAGAEIAEPLFGPAVVDRDQLLTETAGVGHTVFWMGERRDTSLELTVGADQSVQIRYLPAGTDAGAASSHLTVASWPLVDPVSQVKAAAKRDGGMSEKGPDGALHVTNTDTPNNAFLGLPDSTALGEVFAPDPGVAWNMVTSDKVLILQP